MKDSKLTIAALAGSLIALATMATPASACTNSLWKKIEGTSLASEIHGRDCNGNMSVRFTGAVNTGWLAMVKGGGGYTLNSTFVDNNVTTHITLQPIGTIMTANFDHLDNNGGRSMTQGKYKLHSMQ
ncbi:MAG: hypothetical protein WBC71_06640 [Salaquimonas sp.]